jgi:hypothetical protein
VSTKIHYFRNNNNNDNNNDNNNNNGATGTNSKSFRAPYQEAMKLRNYRKLPYWALHTYCGKC